MQSLPILLIVASQGYQPVEYGLTRNALEQRGFRIAVASDQKTACAHTPQDPKQLQILAKYPAFMKIEDTLPLPSININNYQGVFIIGGPGALEHLNTEIVKTIVLQAAHKGLAYGAICISPRILAQAGLLAGKQATGWDSDNELTGIFKQHNVSYVQHPVVVDDKVVTADGPSSAEAFGKAIADVLSK